MRPAVAGSSPARLGPDPWSHCCLGREGAFWGGPRNRGGGRRGRRGGARTPDVREPEGSASARVRSAHATEGPRPGRPAAQRRARSGAPSRRSAPLTRGSSIPRLGFQRAGPGRGRPSTRPARSVPAPSRAPTAGVARTRAGVRAPAPARAPPPAGLPVLGAAPEPSQVPLPAAPRGPTAQRPRAPTLSPPARAGSI